MPPKRRILKYLIVFLLFVMTYICFKSVSREDSEIDNGNLGPNQSPDRHVSPRTNNVNTYPRSSGSVKYGHTSLNMKNTTIVNRECQKPISIPSLGQVSSNSWVTAIEKPHAVHIFSAFTEVHEDCVTITGITNESRRDRYCQVWFNINGTVNIHLSKATVSVIPETHGLRFVPVRISCKVPSVIKTRISWVSIVDEKCDEAKHALAVQHRPDDWTPAHNITLCPAPFNRQYDKLGEFIQYIEVNNLFGADHFIFYNHSVSATLEPYIEYYMSRGTIEVLQWRIPVKTKQGPGNEIHYFGQVIAHAECFLRAMMNSRYVACVDMDEVIVPLTTDDWHSILGDDPSMGVFVFPNVFFRKEWPQDPTFEQEELLRKYPIDALLYTKREPKTWPHNSRSKYIARPEAIVTPGIHYPFETRPGYRSKPVPSSQAILAHYRDWEDYREAQKVEEKRMHVFSQQILDRISRVDQIVNRK